MINRTSSSPILCALVLTLAGPPLLFSKAGADISNTASFAPTDQPAPLEAVPNPVPAPAPVSPTVTSSTTAISPTAPAATVPVVIAPTTRPSATYTVVKGDSWTSIAQKFKTTRKKLKALNNLTASTVKPGQVLLVPTLKSSKSATASVTPKHHYYPVAQPVQDFDIPASTFASCPVPLPSPEDDAEAAATTTAEKPAPVAQLVSPSEMAADESQAQEPVAPAPAPIHITPVAPAPVPQVTQNETAPVISTNHFSSSASSKSPASSSSSYTTSVAPANPHAPNLGSRILNSIFGSNPSDTAANDWGNRFLQQARYLGDQGIEYDEDWRPPGEPHSWTMDCSNTSRYLYKVTAGLELPRTASDQYYYLHLQNKAWDVPQNANGFADTEFLRHHLKPGDLLFWENTYRPDRQPPITHVMVFLGTNDKGQWIMAGSQTSRGGEHNRRNGGPDIYVFRPDQPCGGYTTWLGLVRHQGRFCAYGRPLEADPTKLSVAESN